jgi:UDP-GlcNAc:undecaprenyl-phosphate/decaprenyl-phosphate GlcNAc-1-phosphate transferase
MTAAGDLSALVTPLALGAAALLVAWGLAPMWIRTARKLGFVDHPGERKVHAEPMPTGGGFVVAAAFFAVLWGSTLLPDAPEPREVLGLTCAGLLALALGWADDRWRLPAWSKLIVQATCGWMLHAFGFGVDKLSNPFTGGSLELAGFGVWLDIVWTVAIANAINLIDGLDGLATGVVVISTATLVAVALGHADSSVLWVGAILAGAGLGFLRFNFPPARVFLGDTGSQFLGVTMAGLALLENDKGTAAITLLLPIVAMGLPLLDSVMAFLRRLGRGGRIFRADQEHLHHRLLRLGLTHKQAVVLLYYVCAYLGIAAYVISLLPRQVVLLVLILLAMGLVLALETIEFIDRRTPRR